MAEDKINLKYKGVKPEIANELEIYENKYFREDKPVPFCGMFIYPAVVRDFESFCNCSSCFTLNRKESVEGLKMSNLEYLLSFLSKDDDEGKSWSYKFQKLFQIIFHIKNGIKCKNKECNHIMEYDSPEFMNFLVKTKEAQEKKEEMPKLTCPTCGGENLIEMIKFIKDPKTEKYSLIVDENIISSKDFDRLREIVLFQNFPDYHDDSWVDSALKADYEAKLEIQRKKNDVKASLERKVVALSINTNYKFDEIFQMSIRKFTLALAMIDDLIDYKIMKQAAMSGFVSLPKDQKIEHWLYKSDKDMYGGAYKDMDALKQEVEGL